MWKFVEVWAESCDPTLVRPGGVVSVTPTERDGVPILVIGIFLGTLALFISLAQVSP